MGEGLRSNIEHLLVNKREMNYDAYTT